MTTNLSQLKELPSKWRDKAVRWSLAGPIANGQTVDALRYCADELEPLIADLLRERAKLRLLLFECARELSYVQCVENCNSGLCATSLGADLVERSIKALEIPDLHEREEEKLLAEVASE